jgi:hypothetical protein
MVAKNTLASDHGGQHQEKYNWSHQSKFNSDHAASVPSLSHYNASRIH